MSDKYGRKKVLIIGSTLYVAASAICALSFTVYMMIAARVVQGIGAGAIIAVSTALIKDCFSGEQRTTILALVQSVAGVAPMIAPVLGAILLVFTDWRGSFVVLTIAGVLCLLLSLLYQETLSGEERYEGSIWGSLGRLVTVGKNIGFIVPCMIFSCITCPLWDILPCPLTFMWISSALPSRCTVISLPPTQPYP